MTTTPDTAAQALHNYLDEMENLNRTCLGEDGRLWDHSDLMAQTILEMRAAIQAQTQDQTAAAIRNMKGASHD